MQGKSGKAMENGKRRKCINDKIRGTSRKAHESVSGVLIERRDGYEYPAAYLGRYARGWIDEYKLLNTTTVSSTLAVL